MPLAAYPNAGLPNAFGGYDETPDQTAAALGEWARAGLLNLVGCCCGTTPEHTGRHRRGGRGRRAARRARARTHATRLAGLEPLAIPMPGGAFVNVGERTNVTGSRRFARLMTGLTARARQRRGGQAEDEAVAIARQQVDNGAVMLDVNMDEALLDGVAAMTRFLRRLAAEPDIAAVPVMVDSSKWSVIEAGLRQLQGRRVVNSISLKEGEAEFLRQARAVPPVRRGRGRHGLRRGRPGRDGRAPGRHRPRGPTGCSPSRRASRPTTSSSTPTSSPSAPASRSTRGYAVSFFEATRRLKAELPGRPISGGVSNVSFAFRGNDRVREAIHAVFLFHAIRAGHGHGHRQRGRAARSTTTSTRTCASASRTWSWTAARTPRSGCWRSPRDTRAAPRSTARPATTSRGASCPVDERLTHALVEGIDDYIVEDTEEARLARRGPSTSSRAR